MSNVTALAAAALALGELVVNSLGFGAMRVAGPDIWGDPKDRPAMRRLLVRAFELGHNFLCKPLTYHHQSPTSPDLPYERTPRSSRGAGEGSASL